MQIVTCRHCGKKLFDGILPDSISAINQKLEELYAKCQCQIKKTPTEEMDFTGMNALEIQRTIQANEEGSNPASE